MIEFDDLEVAGGFVIPAEKRQIMMEWARENHHAACYLQLNECQTEPFVGRMIVAVFDMFDERFPTKSVTNDAEFVVRICLATHPGLPIVYKDTEGRWDEMCHDGEKFTGFASGGDTTEFDVASLTVFARHERGEHGVN